MEVSDHTGELNLSRKNPEVCMFFALKLATIINFVSNQTVSNIQQMYFSSGLEIRH